MISIEVRNFGPIAKGKVELKPLTVFVGPNNSGKSYLAVLAYSVLRSMPPFFSPSKSYSFRRVPGSSMRRFMWLSEEVLPDDDVKPLLNSIKQWFDRSEAASVGSWKSKQFGEIPPEVREPLERAVLRSLKDCRQEIGDELERCYATAITELSRKTSLGKGFEVRLSQANPSFLLSVSCRRGKLHLVESTSDMSGQALDFSKLHASLRRSHGHASGFRPIHHALVVELVESFVAHAYQDFLVNPYYLPAARSGILQNHKALAGSAVNRATMAGIKQFPEIPLFPGVVADFLRNVIELDRHQTGRKHLERITSVASFLEENLTKGEIDIEAGKMEYPDIVYKNQSGTFSLHRTSSMVSEVAPVVLFIRYVLRDTSLLIIEEPESHLHPENQRQMATAIVKLVRAGVKVLVTTHSDYFFQQLNNFIMLSQLAGKDRVAHGYSHDDYLAPDEVGAYLFAYDARSRGSVIRRLAMSKAEGITDEEFARVTAPLYDETVSLHRRVETA